MKLTWSSFNHEHLIAWDQHDGNLAVYTLYKKNNRPPTFVVKLLQPNKLSTSNRRVFKWGGWHVMTSTLSLGSFKSWISSFPIDDLHQFYKLGSVMLPCEGWLRWDLIHGVHHIQTHQHNPTNMVQHNSIHIRIHPTVQLPVHKKVIVQVFTVISIQ